MAELTLDSIKGKEVFTTDGKTVGKVERFELDSVLWKVRSFVVEVTNPAMEDLALKRSMLRPNEILVGKELIKSVGDVVNLNVSMTLLRQHLDGPTSKKQVISDD